MKRGPAQKSNSRLKQKHDFKGDMGFEILVLIRNYHRRQSVRLSPVIKLPADEPIIKISENMNEAAGLLRRLVSSQFPLKSHQIRLVWKSNEYKIIAIKNAGILYINPEVIAHNKQIHGRTFKMAAKNRRLYLWSQYLFK